MLSACVCTLRGLSSRYLVFSILVEKLEVLTSYENRLKIQELNLSKIWEITKLPSIEIMPSLFWV